MTIIRLILVKYFPVKNFYANLFYLIVISLLNILWPCLIYHGRVRHILVHFFWYVICSGDKDVSCANYVMLLFNHVTFYRVAKGAAWLYH